MSVASAHTPSSTVVQTGSYTADTGWCRGRLRDYADLCRPRIAVMTMISVAVGFTLASPIVFDAARLFIATLGIIQLVAASSMLNQVLEQSTDSTMARTSGRPIVAGRVSVFEVTFISLVLTTTGFVLLWTQVDRTTALATLLTLLVYVCGYTTLKTRTSLCTTLGAVPGAMPPVLGWLASGAAFGVEAWALFALFFVWQFPHFLAIGWIHRNDYQNAGLRMLPSFEDEGRLTGIFAVIYAAVFVPIATLPATIGMSGNVYFWAGAILSVAYLVFSVRFLLMRSDRRAKQLLYYSLICLPLLLFALVVDFLRLTAFG